MNTIKTLSDADAAIDLLQQKMMAHPAAICPVVHTFTPGLYSRQITMPAGSLITSKIHKTEHPFVISQGSVSVWLEGLGWNLLTAPHFGVTLPGTRRVLVVHEDTVWTTFHPTNLKTVEEIENEIIEPRYDHLAGMRQPSVEEMLDVLNQTLHMEGDA